MKKLFKTLMITCGMLLVSCSSNTPSGVVKQTLEALKEHNFEVYAKNLYVADTSDPEAIEKEIQKFVNMLEEIAKNQSDDDKIKSFKILDEKESESGKWVRVSFETENGKGKKEEGKFYLIKDAQGNWKISLFGSEKLMDK